MIQFLASFFIRDSRNYKSPEVRQAYGVLSGAVGIGLNIFLFFLIGARPFQACLKHEIVLHLEKYNLIIFIQI